MSLISNVLFNIPNATQSLTYTLEGNQVDQIVYSGNKITFEESKKFNLSLEDLTIYISALNLFINTLGTNFIITRNSRGQPVPFSQYSIVNEFEGLFRIRYGQNTEGKKQVYNIIYLPDDKTATFEPRVKLTISLQEFFAGNSFLTFYGQQVNLN